MKLDKMRWAIFGCGAALFAAVIAGAGLKWDSTGLWILGIIGCICLLIAYIGHRIKTLDAKHGKSKIGVTLNDEVREDLTVTGLTGAAGTYSFVHNQLGNDENLSEVKVKLQDDIVKMVKANAFSQPVGEEEVDQVLSSGSPAERVLVFGLLEGNAKLATVKRLRQGILESQSGNEQYHAFLATWTHWSDFTEGEREELRGYIKEAKHYKGDPDRKELADKILAA